MSSMNPILAELDGLSPGAKAALAQAHGAATSQVAANPMAGTQAPQLGAVQHPAAPAAEPKGTIPPIQTGGPTVPPLASAAPRVIGPKPGQVIGSPASPGSVQGDSDERSRLLGTGSGISQIHNPVLRGVATAGNVIGGIVAPGLMRAIPGTEEHHQLLVNRNENQLGTDIGNQQKEAQTAQTQALTKHENASTDVLQNPPDKYSPLPTEQGIQAFDPKTGEAKPLKSETGESLQPFSPDKSKTKTIDEQAYESLVSGGKNPLEALDTIYGAKNTKVEDLPHMYLEALQAGDQQRAALIRKAHEDTQVKPTAAPGVTMIVPDPSNPGGGIVQRLAPGAKVAPGAHTAAGINTMNTPTTQERNVAAQAQLVQKEMPATIAEIQKNAEALGPVMGNWNAFMQGKVGTENPEFAGLRADLLMMSSAVALMHARGRLPENLREEFDRTINAPKQSAQNLVSTLQHINRWVNDNIEVMGAGQGGGHSESAPKDGDTKTNSHGDTVVFRGGKWSLQ